MLGSPGGVGHPAWETFLTRIPTMFLTWNGHLPTAYNLVPQKIVFSWPGSISTPGQKVQFRLNDSRHNGWPITDPLIKSSNSLIYSRFHCTIIDKKQVLHCLFEVYAVAALLATSLTTVALSWPCQLKRTGLQSTGWLRETVNCNFSLAELKSAKNGLPQWFFSRKFREVLICLCLKRARWKKFPPFRVVPKWCVFRPDMVTVPLKEGS